MANSSLESRLRLASVVCGGVAALIGTLALLGWVTGKTLLEGWYVAGITMKANAALCMTLLGVACVLAAAGEWSSWCRYIAIGTACLVLGVAAATFSQHIFAWDLGIDELLFEEPAGVPGTQSPNRMGPVGSLSFSLLSIGLLHRERRRQSARPLFQFLALAVMLLAAIPTLGYAFNAHELFGIARLTAIALPTSIGLLMLAASLLLSRPRVGFVGRLTADDSGALLARRLLPAALLLPPFLMWLRLRVEALGLYDQAFGRALLVLAFIVVFTALVWRTADAVFRQEAAAARAERTLHERLVHSLESMTDGFIACDSNWCVTYMNSAAERMNAARRSEVIGSTFWAVLPAARSPAAEGECRRAMAERVAVHFESFDETSASTFEHHVFPTADGGLAAYVRDVTEQRLALTMLRESERLFRTLGEAMPDLLWMADANRDFVYQNPAWSRYTGLRGSELKAAGWESLLHPEDAPEVAELLQQARLGAPFRVDARMRRHDGEYHWFSLQVVPITDDADRVTRFIGTATDIDERRRAQQALAEADQRKNEFLATLAHELRNPLAPVANAVHLLRMQSGGRRDTEPIFAVIGRQIAHLTRLIDDLMDVGRISQDKLELRKSSVVLAEIVSAAVDSNRYLLEKNQHQLTVTLPEAPLGLEADAVRLVQVFNNLLGNAARYTPPGGRIDVRAWRDGDDVVVRVEDTGIGITAEQMPHIFEMFFQAERENRRGRHGLGIGLALVRKLVALHGGSTSVYSAGEGQGSRFEVRLPLSRGAVALAPNATEQNRAAHALDGVRVLVVEDNQDSAQMLTTVFELSGADVHTAYDGESGVACAKEIAPDVVLLDIGLPEMSGYDVARELRRFPWGVDAFIVALTGWGQADDRARSQDAGFDRHLVKPVNPDELLKMVAEFQRAKHAAAG